MKVLKIVAVSLGLVFVLGGSAHAQSWEASFITGYTAKASLDRQASELDGLNFGGGLTPGAQFGRLLGRRFGVEMMWTQQQTGLQVETGDGDAYLFHFTIDDVHANAVYHFAAPNAALRPFVLAGVGASYLSGGGVPSETKFSWALGGGVKYQPWKSIGIRGQVRYMPVILSDTDAGDFCDPFGFCQGSLKRFDLTGALVFRF